MAFGQVGHARDRRRGGDGAVVAAEAVSYCLHGPVEELDGGFVVVACWVDESLKRWRDWRCGYGATEWRGWATPGWVVCSCA